MSSHHRPAEAATQQAISDFADVLKHYKLQGQAKNYEEFDIVREFRALTALIARNQIQEGADSQEFQTRDLEVKLWDLVENLLRYRYSEKTPSFTPKPFNSDIVYNEFFLTTDPSLYEIWIIISWVQSNAMEVERPKNLSATKWFNTQLANTLESFDSDAPIRLGQSIDERDKEQDFIFYKYIFELILAGKFKEAALECESTNNWTLHMILAGLNSYLDPIVDNQVDEGIDGATHGIKKKALWRRTVYLLSKNEKLSTYEKAIYAYLAGDLSPLDLSISWESHLLIYLNHIFTTEMEHKLIDAGRVPKEDMIMNFPRNDISIQKVLNSLKAKRRGESEHPLRVLSASVISDNIMAIVHSSVNNIAELVNDIDLLRIVTHLAIFVSIIDPPSISVEDKTKLITAYVDTLRHFELYQFMPLYISFLPEIEARNAYSMFLVDFYDSDARPKQLELSRLYKLPLENILKRTVERVFTLTEPNYQLQNGVTLQLIEDCDMQLIRGVEWFIEARMYSDAIHSTVSLLRRFLLTGRVKASQMFASRNSIQQLLKHYDVESLGVLVEKKVSGYEREELLQYDLLISSFNSIEEWQSRPQGTTSYAFMEAMTRVTMSIKETISTVFLDLSQTGYEKDLITDLRSLYIPFLIIELHNVYIDGAPQRSSNLTDALELTNLVSSESTKFYQLFQNCDRLKEYLNLVAHCAAMAASEGL